MWSVGGVMVSIVAFQAVDPGSIPGQRMCFLFFTFFPFFSFKQLNEIKFLFYLFIQCTVVTGLSEKGTAKRTTSLQGTKQLAPKCPFLRGSIHSTTYMYLYNCHTPTLDTASAGNKPGTRGPSVSKAFRNCIVLTINSLTALLHSCS